ncbi:MAG: hypothetical protein ABIM99_00565 [Candidatus Dojkabacteria bacterium]
MPNLDETFSSESNFDFDNLDSIPEETRLDILGNVLVKVEERLKNSKHPALKHIAENLLTLRDESTFVPGVMSGLVIDTMKALNHIIVELANIDLNTNFFYSHLLEFHKQELEVNPNPPTYYITEVQPIEREKFEESKGLMTDFHMLTMSFLNTNILKDIKNPREILFHCALYLTYLSDCIDLMRAIERNEVYVIAVEKIFQKIFKKQTAVAKALIDELNEETGTVSYSSMSPKSRAEIQNSLTIEKIDEPSEYYNYIPNGRKN